MIFHGPARTRRPSVLPLAICLHAAGFKKSSTPHVLGREKTRLKCVVTPCIALQRRCTHCHAFTASNMEALYLFIYFLNAASHHNSWRVKSSYSQRVSHDIHRQADGDDYNQGLFLVIHPLSFDKRKRAKKTNKHKWIELNSIKKKKEEEKKRHAGKIIDWMPSSLLRLRTVNWF